MEQVHGLMGLFAWKVVLDCDSCRYLWLLLAECYCPAIEIVVGKLMWYQWHQWHRAPAKSNSNARESQCK